MTRPTVVIVSNNDWNELWYQRQAFACAFAAAGFKVVFLNKTLTRMPKLRSFIRGNYRDKNRGFLGNPVPEGVTVSTPLWGPPMALLRALNRILIRRTVKSLMGLETIVIVYSPSYNAIDLIRILRPRTTVYVNVHNYEATQVSRDLLRSEHELIQRVDYLFADSHYNQKRLESKLGDARKRVELSPPGVDLGVFEEAYRGDEATAPRTLMYFGGIGSHLDLALYERLCSDYKVIFVGKVAKSLEGQLPSVIEVRPPVPVAQLGEIVSEADVLALFYCPSDYIDAVIPAKLYECLATRKPVLLSGIPVPPGHEGVLYDVAGNFVQAKQVLAGLNLTETDSVIHERYCIARGASWDDRFRTFASRIDVDLAGSRPKE